VISQRALARAAGVAQSVVSRIETGSVVASVETYARLSVALGADLAMRLYPNTGPRIHDRHQSPITESLVNSLGPTWLAVLEVGVHRPARGWIDLVLVDRTARLAIATEVETSPRRLEQVIRWSGAKAESLPSSQGWPFGVDRDGPRIDRLLVLRETRANRDLATAFGATLRAAYPADPWLAHAALMGDAAWPGSALLWSIDRRDGRVDVAPAPRTRRKVATR
jgi:transcriptional regulator with XRE-family HTH domain